MKRPEAAGGGAQKHVIKTFSLSQCSGSNSNGGVHGKNAYFNLESVFL